MLIPGGMPHVIENMGRTSSAVLLRRVRADGPGARLPRSEGRGGARRVRGDPRRAAAGARGGEVDGRRPSARGAAGVRAARARSSRCSSRPRPATTSLYVGILEAEPGAEVPRNSHPGSAEILYVLSGGGEVTDRQREDHVRRRRGAAHPRRPAARRQVHRPGQDGHAAGVRAGRSRRALPCPAAARGRRQDRRPSDTSDDTDDRFRAVRGATGPAGVRARVVRAPDRPQRAPLGRGGALPARDRPGAGRDGPAGDADPGGVRRRGDEVPRLRHRAGGGGARRRAPSG